MTFGKRIKALREDRGWSQRELARRSGLNPQTIHRIEHGGIKGGWQSRSKLSRAFGIAVAELEHPTTQEPTDHAQFAPVATLSEQEIIDGIARLFRELERRKGGTPPNPPPPPAPPTQPPPDRRRRR